MALNVNPIVVISFFGVHRLPATTFAPFSPLMATRTPRTAHRPGIVKIQMELLLWHHRSRVEERLSALDPCLMTIPTELSLPRFLGETSDKVQVKRVTSTGDKPRCWLLDFFFQLGWVYGRVWEPGYCLRVVPSKPSCGALRITEQTISCEEWLVGARTLRTPTPNDFYPHCWVIIAGAWEWNVSLI